MAKKDKSFFDDKRYGFSDANFINREDFYKDLSKPNAYKRIVRDVTYNTISDNDYIYFTHNRFITTLRMYATIELNHNKVIANALSYYVQDVLTTNRIYQSREPVNVLAELNISKGIEELVHHRVFVWTQFLTALDMILNGVATPQQAFDSYRLSFGTNTTPYLDL